MPDRKETLKTEQPNDHDSNRLLIHMCAYRRRKPGVVSGLEKHHHCKNVSFSRRNSELTWRLKLLLKEPKKKKLQNHHFLGHENASRDQMPRKKMLILCFSTPCYSITMPNAPKHTCPNALPYPPASKPRHRQKHPAHPQSNAHS